MKFLIDNNLSPELAKSLNESGFDCVHVQMLNKSSASDEEIFQIAYEEKRIIITADVDFGYILSKWKYNLPSIILFRFFPYNPIIQFGNIIKVVEEYSSDLINGSIIVIEPSRVRIKRLPF
ncbi:MAG: DUF5615 family PIN-like protein [Melioribacteraceae bacterium]